MGHPVSILILPIVELIKIHEDCFLTRVFHVHLVFVFEQNIVPGQSSMTNHAKFVKLHIQMFNISSGCWREGFQVFFKATKGWLQRKKTDDLKTYVK